MKKILLTLILVFICLSFGFASNFSFKFVSLDPLYEAYQADSWNFNTRGQVIKLLDGKGLNQVQICTKFEPGRDDDNYFNYDEIQEFSEDFIMELADFRNKADGLTDLYRVKTGFGAGFLRVGFKDLQVEAAVQGAINLVFDANGGTDCIGFDGVYFLGVNAKYSDLISARFGFHHYFGHYGDEIEEDFMLRKDDLGRIYADRFLLDRSAGGYISRLTQYVRQDSMIAGVTVKPFSWLKVYGEADFLPKKMKNIRPWVLIPNQTMQDEDTTMQSGNGQSEGIYDQAGGERKYAYSDKYKDITLNFGVELSYTFKRIGTVLLAYDMKLFQEGQTMYQIGAYQESNPWDIDHNILLAFTPKDSPVSAELIYHVGRFPLMNFYWYHCSYVSAGFSINI